MTDVGVSGHRRSPAPSGAAGAEVARAVASPARLAAVHATGLLDTEVEAVFDRLTRLAVRLVGVPAAFLSLVDEHRDFYKSACGFGEPLATAREMAGPTFCHHAIQSPGPLVIPDTAADPVYRDVPTVRTLGVAAYVGVPVVVHGHAVGSFCAIDTRPRAWTADEIEVLSELAASAQREIELRAALRGEERAAARLRAQAAELEAANRRLTDQAAELEAQTAALQAAAARLGEQTAAAEDARRVAEAADRAKGVFLANMSHELRTPLNAIGGYVQLLDMGLHGPVTDDQRAALARVRAAQTRLLSLINDVLNYAKLESGKVEYDVRPVDLADVARDVVPLVEPQVRAKGLAFDVRLPDAPCLVWADRERLGQVLVNLLSNAVKFTPSRDPRTGAPGRVTVDVAARRAAAADVVASGPHGHRLADVVFLRVADTGVGVPREKQDAVFEPFVQVRSRHGSYAHATEGTGLGLAISRDLARGMGGDLRVRSREGEGSAFTVKLRRVVDAAGRPTERRSADERREDERRSGDDRRHGGAAGAAARGGAARAGAARGARAPGA